MLRLVTAALLAPIAWLICKRAPLGVALASMLVFVALAAWECLTLFRTRGYRPLMLLGFTGAVVAAWSVGGVSPAIEPVSPAVAVVALAFAIAMFRRDGPAAMLDTVVGTLFPVLYVGTLLGFSLRLRAVGAETGGDLLLLLLVGSFFGDTAAYYAGSAFGRRPLAPAVSPKKTWEGAAGGLLGSVGGTLLAHAWWYPGLSIGHALALGAGLCVTGILGDLSESVVKRAVGAKDSSGLLPGHGGILDRLDSLLVSSPFLYYYFRYFLQGSS